MSTARQKALDRLATESADSVRLANVLAFFASQPLSSELLLSHLNEPLPGASSTPRKAQARQLLNTLARHSLLTFEDGRVMITGKVSAALRDRLDEEEKVACCAAALRVLRSAFPTDSDDVDEWATCEQLLPHLLAATGHAESLESINADALWLLDRAALFEDCRGRYAEAHGHIQSALAGASSCLSEKDPLLGTLHHTAGSIFSSRGLLEAAHREQERALEIHRATLPPEDALILRDLASLAFLQVELGQAEEAESNLQRALDAREDMPDERADYEAWGACGWARLEQKNAEGAIFAYQRALALATEMVGEAHPDAASLRSGYGLALERAGRAEEARHELERAAADAEARLGVPHPQVAVAKSNLAGVLQGLGRLEEAREQLEIALRSGKATLHKDHQGLWIRHKKLSAVLYSLQDLEGAQEHAEAALEISKRSLGPADLRVAEDLSSLAEIFIAKGQSNEALKAYDQALAVVKAEFGEGHPQTAGYHYALGRALQAAGDLRAAQAHLSEALQVYEKAKGPEDSATSRARSRLTGIIDASAGQAVAALRVLGREEEAQAVQEQVFGTFSALLEEELERGDATSLQVLAEVAYRHSPEIAKEALRRAEELLVGRTETLTGRRGLGIAWYQLGRDLLEKQRDEEAIEAFVACNRLSDGTPQMQGMALHEAGNLLRKQGRLTESAEAYREAAERKREALGRGSGSPRDLTVTLLELGRAYLIAGRLDDALAVLEERLKILSGLTERDPQAEGVTLHDLGSVREARGELGKAADLFELAIERKREAQSGDGNPRDLAITLLALGRANLRLEKLEEARQAHEDRLQILKTLEVPDLQGEGVTLHDLGDVCGVAGEIERAAELYERAAERKREAQGRGGTPQDLAITLLALGRSMKRLQRAEPALAAYRERLETLSSLPERDPRHEGEALHDIGDALRMKDEPQEAAKAYERAAEMRRQVQEKDADRRNLATTLRELGRAWLLAGQAEKASAVFEERLDILETLSERDRQAEGVTRHDLADVRVAEGKLAEAIELFERAAADKEKAQKRNGEPWDLGITLRELGRAQMAAGNLDTALDVQRRRLEVLASMAVPDPRAEGEALQDIGEVLRLSGQPEVAAGVFREALAKRREGAPRKEIADTLLAIAACEKEVDKGSTESVAAAREAAEFINGDEDPALRASALVLLAQAALATGDVEQAVPALEEANALLDRNERAPALDIVAARALMGAAYEAAGAEPEAERLRTEVAKRLSQAIDETPDRNELQALVVAWNLCADSGSEVFASLIIDGVRSATAGDPAGSPRKMLLAELLHFIGREREMVSKNYDGSLAAYQERLDLLGESTPPDPMAEGSTLDDLGDVRRAQGNLKDAAELYRRAAERKREANDGTAPGYLALTLLRLGEVELQLDEVASALELGTEAHDLLRSESPPNPALVVAALDLRGEALLRDGSPEEAVKLLEEADRMEGDERGSNRRGEVLASARAAAATK